MAKAGSLSEQDVAGLGEALAAGKPATVWFTSAAVGFTTGASAKVIGLDEPAEGDFIRVQPSGSKDVLSFSPGELTVQRPARGTAPKRVPKAAARPAEPEPVESAVVVGLEPGPATPPPAPKPSRAPAPKVRRPAEVTVTLHSTVDGEWTVEVLVGAKRTVRPTSVPASDVAKAARSLPGVVGEAIEASLAAARDLQLERVAQLKAELEAAQRALADLG